MTRQGLVVVRNITPLHCGVGRGDGVIDLPVTRDVVTSNLIIHDTQFRGALRDEVSRNATPPGASEPVCAAGRQLVNAIFGPEFEAEGNENRLHRAMLALDDVHLLALPIVSPNLGFVWATDWERLALYRERACFRDASKGVPVLAAPDKRSNCWYSHKALATGDEGLWIADRKYPRRSRGGEGEALDGTLHSAWCEHLFPMLVPVLAAGTSKDELQSRLVILPAGDLPYFCQVGTDVRPRIRRLPDGTVADQAFWREEFAPRDSLWFGGWSLQALPGTTVDEEAVGRWLQDQTQDRVNIPLPTRFQMAGKMTHGKGWLHVRFV